jgi:hypothetical protein
MASYFFTSSERPFGEFKAASPESWHRPALVPTIPEQCATILLLARAAESARQVSAGQSASEAAGTNLQAKCVAVPLSCSPRVCGGCRAMDTCGHPAGALQRAILALLAWGAVLLRGFHEAHRPSHISGMGPRPDIAETRAVSGPASHFAGGPLAVYSLLDAPSRNARISGE